MSFSSSLKQNNAKRKTLSACPNIEKDGTETKRGAAREKERTVRKFTSAIINVKSIKN